MLYSAIGALVVCGVAQAGSPTPCSIRLELLDTESGGLGQTQVIDYNGDGFADLYHGGSVHLLDEDGLLTPLVPVRAGIYAFVVAPFKFGAFTTLKTYVMAFEKEIVLGRGGAWLTSESVPVSTIARSIRAFDADADGDTDIVLTSYDNDIRILRHIWESDFEEEVIAMTGSLPVLEAADIDGDGDQDLVVREGSSISVYSNDSGQFVNTQVLGHDLASEYPVLADLDNDTDLDLIVRGSGSPRTIVYRNDEGTFVPVLDEPIGEAGGRVLVADLDNDGLGDLVFADPVGDRLWILRNLGAFVLKQTSIAFANVNRLVAISIPGSTELGLAVGVSDGLGSTWILRVECVPTCPADVNLDGSVDIFDVAYTLESFGTPLADTNADGTTDTLDLNEVLGKVGTVCIDP